MPPLPLCIPQSYGKRLLPLKPLGVKSCKTPGGRCAHFGQAWEMPSLTWTARDLHHRTCSPPRRWRHGEVGAGRDPPARPAGPQPPAASNSACSTVDRAPGRISDTSSPQKFRTLERQLRQRVRGEGEGRGPPSPGSAFLEAAGQGPGAPSGGHHHQQPRSPRCGAPTGSSRDGGARTRI